MAMMPRYQCHKRVWALKIKAVYFNQDGSVDIVPEESGYARFTVPPDKAAKHEWSIGGYYVQYEDGYVSYSPAKAFEEGYTRI